MLAAGEFAERVPGLHGDFAIGLRREDQDHLGGVDIGLDARQALGGALLRRRSPLSCRGNSISCSVFQRDALAAIAELGHQRPKRRERW